jgi:hypothetical protein
MSTIPRERDLPPARQPAYAEVRKAANHPSAEGWTRRGRGVTSLAW